MQHYLQKVLMLIAGVLTRWTSIFQSLERLIQCSKPLKACALNRSEELIDAAGTDARSRQTAQKVLDILNDSMFWRNIAR